MVPQIPGDKPDTQRSIPLAGIRKRGAFLDRKPLSIQTMRFDDLRAPEVFEIVQAEQEVAEGLGLPGSKLDGRAELLQGLGGVAGLAQRHPKIASGHHPLRRQRNGALERTERHGLPPEVPE